MKFHEINSETHNIIDAYDHNSIRIKKNTYQKGVIIFPEKIISRSDIESYEDLKFDNLKIKGYDIMEDLTNPFGDKPWLVKDKLKDLILF